MRVLLESKCLFDVVLDQDAEGNQIISLPDTERGRGLAALLDARGTRVNGWLQIKHDQVIDEKLMQLVDLAAEIRRRAPRLMQLSFLDEKGKL